MKWRNFKWNLLVLCTALAVTSRAAGEDVAIEIAPNFPQLDDSWFVEDEEAGAKVTFESGFQPEPSGFDRAAADWVEFDLAEPPDFPGYIVYGEAAIALQNGPTDSSLSDRGSYLSRVLAMMLLVLAFALVMLAAWFRLAGGGSRGRRTSQGILP